MSSNAPDGLNPKKQEAIVALLNCPTVKKAAEQIGVNEKTLHRWMDEEAFGRTWRKARRSAFRHAISLTQQYAPMAVATLTKISTDPNAPHAARVSASTALLKFGRESIELDDVVERVGALEQQVQASKGAA